MLIFCYSHPWNFRFLMENPNSHKNNFHWHELKKPKMTIAKIMQIFWKKCKVQFFILKFHRQYILMRDKFFASIGDFKMEICIHWSFGVAKKLPDIGRHSMLPLFRCYFQNPSLYYSSKIRLILWYQLSKQSQKFQPTTQV